MASPKHIRGQKGIIYMPVDSDVVLAGTGLCRQATDDVRPLSTMSDAGSKAQNQEAAHDVFLGVNLKPSALGETSKIPVATEGIWEFDCTSGTYEVGDMVGPEGTGAGAAVGVSNTVLAAVATANLAVGRVAKRGTTVTRVQVNIESVVMTGGVRIPVDPT